MTAIPAEIALARRPPFRDAGLWLGAGMIVFVAHAAFAYLLRDVGPVPVRDALEQAMEIDLAPIPVSIPQTVQSETLAREDPVDEIEPVEDVAEAVEPELDRVVADVPKTVDEAKPEPKATQPEPETEQPVAEEARAEPETVEVEPKEVESQEAEEAEPELVEEETVEAVTPEVAIPLPQPRPERQVEERLEPQKNKLVRRKVEVAKEKAKKAARPPKQKTTLPASQASAASRAPKIDPSRWNSAVRAAIARRAGAVRGMRGTVRISFVVNASGAIVSASVSSSSGNPKLDRAALGMVRSARVPAPPDGLGGSRHAFAIPLSFR